MASKRLLQADRPQRPQAPSTPAERALRQKIDALVARQHFCQAIRKLQQALKRDPKLDVGIGEAQLWLMEGQHLLGQGQLPRAEAALRQAIELGLYGSSHYGLARCLLAQNKGASALESMHRAFNEGTLPREFGGAYLKLLLIQGELETLRQQILDHGQRFAAHHLQWAQGALALVKGDPKAARAQFRLVMVPVSPGDSPTIWRTYVQLQDVQADGSTDGPRPSLEPAGHPAIQALALREAARRREPPGEWLDLDQSDLPDRSAALALELVQRIRRRELVTAALLLQRHGRLLGAAYPELEPLRQPLLALAGEQALSQGDPKTAAELWRHRLSPSHFEPGLAVRLFGVLDEINAHQEAEQLASRLIQWLRQEARRQPHDWPEQRLSDTLAVLHCWMADQQIAWGLESEAHRTMRQAEMLCSNHPEVVGRKGLIAALEDDTETAIALLWQALESGCTKKDVYIVLIDCLEAKGDRQQLKELRNKHGQAFHDVTAGSEADIPAWLEALNVHDYSSLRDFLAAEQQPSPPLQALRIFLDCATEEPAPGKKVGFDLQPAGDQWQALLETHGAEQQVEILKAIYWMIQLHARRNRKGVAALQADLFRQICALSERIPAALQARLILLSVRISNAEERNKEITRVLRRATDPGRLLARAMLELRLLAPNRAFKEVLEDQWQRDTENPMLLLAKATLHRSESEGYYYYRSKGFELARRLQDSEALEAFRVEDWRAEQAAMASPGRGGPLLFNNFNEGDFLDFMKQFVQSKGPENHDQDDDGEDEGDDEDNHTSKEVTACFGTPNRRKSGRRRKAFHQL